MNLVVTIFDEQLFHKSFPIENGKPLLQPEWYMEDGCLIIPVYQELLPVIQEHHHLSLHELFELKDSNGEYLLPWDLPFFEKFGKVKLI